MAIYGIRIGLELEDMHLELSAENDTQALSKAKQYFPNAGEIEIEYIEEN